MELEFIIVNRDDAVALVYKHETLGRVVVVNGSIDSEYPLEIHSSSGGLVKKENMMEFLLKVLPKKNNEYVKE